MATIKDVIAAEDLGIDLDRLAMTEEEVARLTRPEREARTWELVAESHALLDAAISAYVTEQGKQLVGIVTLFSGGNDSTVLAHLFRERSTHAGHANTGIGVEETRQFVRDTCADWGLPLLERSAWRDSDRYRALVLDQGFPGPGHHFKMFQRLKERALEQIRNELIQGRTRTRRVIFLAGRRRQESARRASVPEFERLGSTIWVSPMVNWTKQDMNTYRLLHDVPRNRVSDLIHMSGECLCGSFAKQGERAEIEFWFPFAFAEVAELEELLRDREDIPEHKRTWGWGWQRDALERQRKRKPKTGRLCSSCDARFDADQQADTITTTTTGDAA